MKLKVIGNKKNDCLLQKISNEKRKKMKYLRIGVCALHTLGRHVVKHGLKFEIAGVKVAIAKKI